MQGDVGIEVLEQAAGGLPSQRLALSVCAMTRTGPARLAAALELLRPVAAEIVVALDDRAEERAEILTAVAGEVVVFPHRDPADSVIPWLHSLCGQAWILNLDDDEMPSEGLVAQLPELLAADVMHWWLPRRWLVGDARTSLDEPPWVPDYQLRLYRNDPATLRFSDEFHRPVIVSGPGGFATEPIWHLDCLVNSFARRRMKAVAYERARRGMRIAGFAHNSGFYLPELRPGVRTATLRDADARRVERVLEAIDPPAVGHGVVRRAGCDEIEALWPGGPYEASLYDARLTRLGRLDRLTAGSEHTVPVAVANLSRRMWLRGSDAAPLIQVGTRWLVDGRSIEGIHTALPADLPPAHSLVVPVHVRAPVEPGRYRLVVDLVHEHVRWFDRALTWAVDVPPRRRVALVGRGAALAQALDQMQIEPELETVLVERGDSFPSERYGHQHAPGLGGYLLEGVDGRMTARLLIVLAARTVRLLRRARRMRSGRPTAPIPRGGEACLAALATCERLQIASPDWGQGAARTRELWRLAATVASAKRLGLAVDVRPGALAIEHGALDRWIARLVRPVSASQPTR